MYVLITVKIMHSIMLFRTRRYIEIIQTRYDISGSKRINPGQHAISQKIPDFHYLLLAKYA